MLFSSGYKVLPALSRRLAAFVNRLRIPAGATKGCLPKPAKSNGFLWIIRTSKRASHCEGLAELLMRDLDPEFIQSELGELLRMAASINDGYGSATFLLERFGSAARNSKLHRAGTQWGQWWDSVYLCDQ